MSITVASDLNFVGGAKIGGLPPATAPGEAATYEQIGGQSQVELVTVLLPDQVQSYEASIARPGTLPTQNLRAWLAPTGDTDDNDLWQLEGVQINGMCQTDEIVLFISCQYFESGNIKINYQVF